MAINISLSSLNSTTDNEIKKYYNQFFIKKNLLDENDEYNNKYYSKFYDNNIEKTEKYHKHTDFNYQNTSINKNFFLSKIHQLLIERFYKIACTIKLITNNHVGSKLNLTRIGLIQNTNKIIQKMCYTPYNDLETLRIIDTQLQEIEKITMNMAKDLGLSTTSTTTKEVEKESTKILTDTTKLQSKYFNNLLSQPVFISDDKTFLVNRNVKCHKTGKMQVEIVKKINIKNYSNVNVIGKLIGLRGNTIKNLEKSTQSKIIIRGKGSMRNDGLEKYLIQQGICYHLIEPLHILVTTRTSSEDGCLEKLELVKKKIISILCQKKNTHQR